MSPKEVQVNFRMPASLKAELENSAKMMNRSLTAEIVWRLEKTVEVGLAHFDIPAFVAEYKREKDEELRIEKDALSAEKKALASALMEIRAFRDELEDITKGIKKMAPSKPEAD